MAEGTGLIYAKFVIKKISHRNDDTGYTVAKGTFTEYRAKKAPTKDLTIVGNFVSVFEGDEFEAEGTWNNHDIFGYQFVVGFSKRVVPQTLKGIQEFLRRNVKGIGKKTAERIVEHLKEETLSRIEKDWQCLVGVGGISVDRAKKIHEKLAKHKRFEEIAMFVLNHGGGYKTAMRVYDTFGESSIAKIRENPYVLCSIPKIEFPTADRFARKLGFSFDNKERIENAVLYFLEECTKSGGHLYVTDEEIKEKLSAFLKLDRVGSFQGIEDAKGLDPNDIQKGINELKQQEKVVIEVNDAGEQCVYLATYSFIEKRIVDLLKKLVEEQRTPLCLRSQIDEFIDQYEKKFSFRFASKQKEAIYMALQHGISILTGGPGTGKTQTINSIIQCLKHVKADAIMHLFAPTGKASRRMAEMTGMDAKTIHSGIGLNGFENDNDIQEIVGDLLVIDESSMVDAYVFYKLLSSIQENTRILFVGDYDQLPSVGPGLILRDLINSGRIPTVRLDEIFRQSQDSQIVMNSHKVIQGKTTKDIDGITFDPKKEDFYFIEKYDRIKAQEGIIECVKRLIHNQGYSLDDIQLLSPMRKGDLGVWTLNAIMQEVFNPPTARKQQIKLDETSFLRDGDKVIHTVNNRDLGVFNGEVGKVNRIYEDEDGDVLVDVEYDGRTVTYNDLTIDEVELAYCTTIHKSQGSEYPIVIMPIHPSQESMLTKNLIYTAWTRARKKVVMVGAKTSLDKGILKSDTAVRNSRIREKIMKEISG